MLLLENKSFRFLHILQAAVLAVFVPDYISKYVFISNCLDIYSLSLWSKRKIYFLYYIISLGLLKLEFLSFEANLTVYATITIASFFTTRVVVREVY